MLVLAVFAGAWLRWYQLGIQVLLDDEWHAVHRVLHSDAAGIATTSLKYATHFKRHSQAGMVMVNLPTAGVDFHVPFGGRKGSSYGPREQGAYARDFYTAVKTAYTFAG